MHYSKLSIITVNKNNAEGLKKTIASVDAQTWRGFTHIIVDGASTDGSAELALNRKNDYSICISESDSGIYNAMNKGIGLSTSEWLLFLNSGDCFAGDVLGKCAAFFDTDADVLYGDGVWDENGARSLSIQPQENIISSAFFLRHSIMHQAAFMRRSAVLKFRYREDFTIISDKILFYRLAKDGSKFRKIPLRIALIDHTGISASERFSELHDNELRRFITEECGAGSLAFYADSRLLTQIAGLPSEMIPVRSIKRLRRWVSLFYIMDRSPLLRWIPAAAEKVLVYAERKIGRHA